MDYTLFVTMAKELLSEFGGVGYLLKPDGRPSFDPELKRVAQKRRRIEGLVVKTQYSAQAIGESGGVIKAGAALLVCQFDEPIVEDKDEIEFGGVVYNCVRVDTIQPNGMDTIVYIVQGGKS